MSQSIGWEKAGQGPRLQLRPLVFSFTFLAASMLTVGWSRTLAHGGPCKWSTHSLSLQLLSRHLHFVLIHWVFKMIKELRVYGPGAKSPVAPGTETVRDRLPTSEMSFLGSLLGTGQVVGSGSTYLTPVCASCRDPPHIHHASLTLLRPPCSPVRLLCGQGYRRFLMHICGLIPVTVFLLSF